MSPPEPPVANAVNVIGIPGLAADRFATAMTAGPEDTYTWISLVTLSREVSSAVHVTLFIPGEENACSAAWVDAAAPSPKSQEKMKGGALPVALHVNATWTPTSVVQGVAEARARKGTGGGEGVVQRIACRHSPTTWPASLIP